MKPDNLNERNLGAACKLYRMRYTDKSQLDFAAQYDMSVSNLCGYENGYVMSIKCFLAYIHDGFLSRLPEIPESDISEEVNFQQAAREYKMMRKVGKKHEAGD